MIIDNKDKNINLIKWNYVKPLKNETAVSEFLGKNNIDLPQNMIDFITINNGGRPSKNVFDTQSTKERVFKALLSYNKEDKENIYKIFTSEFKDRKLYPIASDPAGNFICIELKNDNRLILFEHESLKKEYIASNVEELLNLLYK